MTCFVPIPLEMGGFSRDLLEGCGGLVLQN
jgi:hypothetical protein